MNQQTWIELLKIAIWPITILIFSLIVLITFKKSIAEYLKKVQIAKYGPLELRANEEKLDQTIQEIKDLKKDFDDFWGHEEPFPNTEAAFTAASKYIAAYLEENKNEEVIVNLKLLAIAMTFSWSFVTQHIPKILNKYEKARINIEILVVDPKFLDTLTIDRKIINWGQRCRGNLKSIKLLAQDPLQHQGRLSIELRTYNNLPHWHGLWINGRHLFLGRADWEFETDRPKLTVGTNTYRHFSVKETQGAARIKLFENWHRYYFEHAHTNHYIKRKIS